MSVHDRWSSIEQFLSAAAAKVPTPGGGSVAALAGALAAAMGEMVVQYSIGKKDLESHTPELQSGLAQFARCRDMMLEFMVEDQLAYQAMSEARQSETPGAAETAAIGAIVVPQAIAGAATELLELADRLVDRVNARLLSDLAVCADLAMATVRSAISNVRVNLPGLTDEKRRWEAEATAGQMLSRALVLVQRVSPRIWQRIAAESGGSS